MKKITTNESSTNSFEGVPQPGDVVTESEVTVFGQVTIRFKSGTVVTFPASRASGKNSPE